MATEFLAEALLLRSQRLMPAGATLIGYLAIRLHPRQSGYQLFSVCQPLSSLFHTSFPHQRVARPRPVIKCGNRGLIIIGKFCPIQRHQVSREYRLYD